MGSALIKGLISSGRFVNGCIFAYDIDREKVDQLSKSHGIAVCESEREIVEKCDIIVLAVKPGTIPSALKDFASFPGGGKAVVSIAAGISIHYIKSIIGNGYAIARAMPNIPALVGEGMTAIAFDQGFSAAKKQEVLGIFESVGKAEVMDESLMNGVTALSGSSPAYVFILIDAMADAAVRSGINRNTAYRLAAQSVLGAARMVLETGLHPCRLKDDVCSPAGTTIEAVNTLEKTGFRYSIIEAMRNCEMKAKELEKK